MDGVGCKKVYEVEFKECVMGNFDWCEKYGSFLSSFECLYSDFEFYVVINIVVGEIVGCNIELFCLANILYSIVKMYEFSGVLMVESWMDQIRFFVEDFYKDYELVVDQGVFVMLMDYYFIEIFDVYQVLFVVECYVEVGKDVEKLAFMIYLKSKLACFGVLELVMEEGLEVLIKFI